MSDLAPRPERGRVFETTGRVRLGDADPAGRLRLDALARTLQDLGNDDLADAGLDPSSPWLARRSVVVAERWPQLGEATDLATWCGGTGSRWAERRSSVRTATGAVVDVATLWVFVDGGRPARLPQWFADTYGEACRGRTVSSRLTLPPPPEDAPARPWAIRAADLDVLGHVNNAATWAAVEEECARGGIVPRRATLEYHAPIEWGDDVELRSERLDGGLRLWLVVDGATRAAAEVSPRPATE